MKFNFCQRKTKNLQKKNFLNVKFSKRTENKKISQKNLSYFIYE